MSPSLLPRFSSSLQKNRRKIPRYGVGSLRVWFHKPRFLGLFDNLIELSPIDFNGTGLAFRHTHLLSPGQSLVLDLVKDKYRLTNIVVVVRYTTQLSNHFRTGVEFDFNANKHMRSLEVRRAINEIEFLLKDVIILARY